jgi:hypothetical protein
MQAYAGLAPVLDAALAKREGGGRRREGWIPMVLLCLFPHAIVKDVGASSDVAVAIEPTLTMANAAKRAGPST